MAINVDIGGQTISWFKDRLHEGRLNFKPPFQRNPVWLPKHKAYLIDTVVRGLPVPEVYVQKETDALGATTYSIVDGQQRLRTLLEFARGEVELMDTYSPGREGHTWENLSEEEKIAYWNYKLVVREVSGANDSDLRDLFRRLNQHTVVLNQQEIRNARYKGDFINTVTELADQAFWSKRRIVTPREIRRMEDIEYMSELLLGIMHGPQNKKLGLDAAFETYEGGIPEKQVWLKRFERSRELSEVLVPVLEDSRWRGKSDYYALFLALDTLSETGTLRPASKKKAIESLKEFGSKVTKRLSKVGSSGRAAKPVRDYATAVEKAASDKDRRQKRMEILVDLLQPHFGPHAV